METALTKALKSKVYSFNSRFSTREAAREKAQKMNGSKHAYYTKVTVKGAEYFDVRTEN